MEARPIVWTQGNRTNPTLRNVAETRRLSRRSKRPRGGILSRFVVVCRACTRHGKVGSEVYVEVDYNAQQVPKAVRFMCSRCGIRAHFSPEDV